MIIFQIKNSFDKVSNSASYGNLGFRSAEIFDISYLF